MSYVAETAELAWGYTMADVERLAWGAVRRSYSSIVDTEEKYSAAWHGVAYALYRCEEKPSYKDLLYAGFEALDEAIGEARRCHSRGPDGNERPFFIKYWLPPVHLEYSDGFSEHLVETIALPAALSVLSAQQYEAIATLAAHDNDMAAAADSLGVSYSTYASRVSTARKNVLAVWFEGETPVGRGNPGDTCRSGHSRAEHGVQRPSGKWRCKVCTRNSVRRRLKGRSTAQVAGKLAWQKEFQTA